jgi:hypothetical protein
MTVADTTALAEIVRIVMSSQLEPIAFEITTRRSTQSPPNSQNKTVSAGSADSALNVVLRFASLPPLSTRRSLRRRRALKACVTSIEAVDSDAERALWDAHATEIWSDRGP